MEMKTAETPRFEIKGGVKKEETTEA